MLTLADKLRALTEEIDKMSYLLDENQQEMLRLRAEIGYYKAFFEMIGILQNKSLSLGQVMAITKALREAL